MRRALALLLVSTLLAGTGVVGAPPAAADTTITVTSTADVLTSIRFTTLREAVETAATATGVVTILLQPGLTYPLTTCTGGTEDANVRGDLDVRGTAASVVIDGQGATIDQTCAGERVVDHLGGPSLTLRRVTITGGDAVGDGGGVRSAGSLTVSKATVRENRASGDGGGLRAESLAMAASDVLANEAGGDGGGIHAGRPGIPPAVITLERVEVGANVAGGAGGGVLLGGAVTVRRSAVVGNEAAETGGAVLPLATLENTTVADNAETGPASVAAGVEVTSTTSLTLRHVTVRGGSGDGGAVVAPGVFQATAAAVAEGASGEACGGSTAESGGGGANADDDASCGFDEPDDRPAALLGLTTAPAGAIPAIVPAGSSVLVDIDADCGAGLTIDQGGRARPQGGGCDGGAVELRRRTDAMVRRSTATTFRGNNVYHPQVGPDQIILVETPRRVAGVGVVRLQNDGEVRERQVVVGPGSNNQFTVRYVSNGVDVTAAVVAGTFQTAALHPGATQDLQVRVTPRATTPRGTGRQVSVRTRLLSEPAPTDGAAVFVNVS